MKKIFKIIQCGVFLIKKKFFNNEKTDISHECERLLNLNENSSAEDENNQSEEYINNYAVTTRWQTV